MVMMQLNKFAVSDKFAVRSVHLARRHVIMGFVLSICVAVPATASQEPVLLPLESPGTGSAVVDVQDLVQPEGLTSGDPQEATSSDPQEAQPPAQAEPHPTPEHTGFQALVRTLGADFLAFPRRPSTWVIVSIGAGTALAGHPFDDEVNSHIVGSQTVGRFFAPGKWIGSAWVQGGTAVGLYAVGRYVLPPAKGEARSNRISHLGYDLLRAQIVSQTLVQSLKHAIRRDRPTGECCAFPSGHAATAFAAASVLERHLGYRAAWPTLVIATYVGVSRLHDNRHFLSDVLFGSAIGIASGWTTVARHGRSEYALMPVPVRGGMAFAVTRVSPRS